MTDHAHEIDWEFMDCGASGAIRVGDLVSADAGGLPIYRVMSLQHDRAWLRDIDTDSDRVTPLRGFYWKGRRA